MFDEEVSYVYNVNRHDGVPTGSARSLTVKANLTRPKADGVA